MMQVKIPAGAETLVLAFNGEMSKINDEQREAMTALNDEANRRLAEQAEEQTMKEEIPEGIKRAHEQGGPTMDYAHEVMEEKLPPGITRVHDESRIDDIEAACETLVEAACEIEAGAELRYTQPEMAEEFKRIFDEEILPLWKEGTAEYAHAGGSPFANFERGAKEMGIDRKQVLWVYAMKHKDGIAAALKGHTSQREDVRGRINDLIVYLLLHRGMLNEEAGNTGNFGMGELKK